MASKIFSRLKKIRFGFLEKPLSRLCYKYSWFVAEHPWPFIIIPVLATASLAYGYLNKHLVIDTRLLFLPDDAPSKMERAIIEDFFPPVDGAYVPSRATNEDGQVAVILTAQDDGSILRPEYRKAVVAFNDYAMNKIFVEHDGIKYTYPDLCLKFLRFCHTNPQIYAIDAMYSNPGPYDNNSYPTAQHGFRRFYIGGTLGGVKTDILSRQILEAKAWQLVYQMKADQSIYPITYKMMRKMEDEFLAYDDDFLDVAFMHSESLNIEVEKNSTTNHLMIRFLACAFMLWLFATLCSITTLQENGHFYVDWSRSKITVASCGLLGALMGIISCVGGMAYLGFAYYSVVDTMPFLVLGVRLDNTFLMMSAVHRTKRTLNAQERLAEAMSEAAVSITITVLTDILSFAIGLITDFLAVQMFSLYTVVAITITFIYQLTFLLGVLALSLRYEEKGLHNVVPCKETVKYDENLSTIQKFLCLGSRNDIKKPNYDQDGTWISKMIRYNYAPFLMKWETKFSVICLYVVYLSTALYGCAIAKQGLEPTRLLVDDSYAIKYYRRLEDYFWNIGLQVQIVFSNAGDLSNRTNRENIMYIIDEFANSQHGMGSEGIDFWLTSFNNFLIEYNGRSIDFLLEQDFFTNVAYFLSAEENAHYRNDIVWRNKSTHEQIGAFRALVGVKNMSKTIEQMETVDQFRAIANKYPSYNISTFEIIWIFVDQYEAVLPNTIQEIYSGISFMILIAIFFIPSIVCSLCVALAILSIDAGVVGLMTFWDINLDIISMITIIMSIGFSVDFTAHIAYAYVVSDGDDKTEKTVNALAALAWPISQGALATVMGVVVLAGTNSYITTAFFRTVFLVIVIGYVHAILFLPVVLSIFSFKLSTKICKKEKNGVDGLEMK